MPNFSLTLGVAHLLFYLASRVLADTCSTVETETSIKVSRPLSLTYNKEQNEYWSEACSLLKPSCIIFPKTTNEVAAILKVLGANDEQFSVKSGGHNPNLYFSSIEDGPIISMAEMDSLILDTESGILEAGPGNRLDEVAKQLDGTGWTALGGRIGNVGLGGLILGGGLSYMAAQYGWSASSVLEYEVVLANGTIVNASADKHRDLFRVLKGGGNNFGIVTRFTMQCYRQGEIWGGNLAFLRTEKTDEKILKAVRDFTEYNDDNKAAVIVTAERGNIDLIDSWILFLFYDGPNPPENVFKNFTDIKPILNTCKTQSFAKLVTGSNWVIVQASTVVMGTDMIPIPKEQDSTKVLGALHEFWRKVSDKTLLVPGIITSVAYQPFPKNIARASRHRGYDLYDMQPDADKLLLDMTLSFLPITSRDAMNERLEEMYRGYRERVVGWQNDGTLPDNVDLPLFMNYASENQDLWARLKSNARDVAREVSEAYDPAGLFKQRTGGFKP